MLLRYQLPHEYYMTHRFADNSGTRLKCKLNKQEYAREKRGDCEQDGINEHSIRSFRLDLISLVVINTCDAYPYIHVPHDTLSVLQHLLVHQQPYTQDSNRSTSIQHL